jgi:hypothetical protein
MVKIIEKLKKVLVPFYEVNQQLKEDGSVIPSYCKRGLFWRDMDGMSFYSEAERTKIEIKEFKYYRPVHRYFEKHSIRFYWIPVIPFVIIYRTTKRILKFLTEDILRCGYLINEHNQNKCQNKNKTT